MQLLRRRRRQLQETLDLMIKTTALHVHHAPNLTFGGRGHTTTNFPSSF